MRTLLTDPWILLTLLLVAAAGCNQDGPPAANDPVQTSERPSQTTKAKSSDRASPAPKADKAKPANAEVESEQAATDSTTDGAGSRPVTASEPASTSDEPMPAADDPMPAVQETSPGEELPAAPFEEPKPSVNEDALAVDAAGLTRLNPEFNVWLDPGQKRVVMYGEICRREGPLEMFACLKGSKEHESIVAVYTQAFIVHAALQALGADPGKPVSFRPAYTAAEGPEVEVTVHWKDAKGKLMQARAQDWVREVKSKKALEHPWVFAGSGFWVNEKTGEQHFLAEDGDFICVSNFPSALLDLPIASTDSASALLFEAFTEHIPPQDTKLTLVLTPKIDPAASKKADAKPADGSQPSAGE